MKAADVRASAPAAEAARPVPKGPSPFWRLRPARGPAALHVDYTSELALFRSGFSRFWVVALLALLGAAPFLLTDFWLSVASSAAIAALGAIGLNLLTGYTGQVSLGHAFFIGLGAYTAGYLGGDKGLPVLVWLPVAGVLGAAVGLVVGPFALRLKGLYLAIVTIGLVFLGEHLFLNLRFITGGPQGRDVPSPEIGGLSFAQIGGLSRDQSFYLFVVPLVVVGALFAKNVARSRPGRAFQAIRDREIAAAVIGVNLARYKVAAFALSSFYAAVAGALLGSYLQYVTPQQFNLVMSIEYVAMIIVGGVGTIMGSILGAVFITMIPRLIDEFGDALPFLSASSTGSGLSGAALKQIIFGVLIVVFLVVEPRGLAGIWTRIKVYFKSWPFSY